MNFKLGDKVTIKKCSQYYIGDYHNPVNVKGTIIYITFDNSYLVKWCDRFSSVYSIKDIELEVNYESISNEFTRFN